MSEFSRYRKFVIVKQMYAIGGRVLANQFQREGTCNRIEIGKATEPTPET